MPFHWGCRILARVQPTVTQLTNELVASYARVGGINHLDGKNLPSKYTITQIAIELLQLLFPGFFQDRSIHISELKIETATLMDSIQGRLEDEIYKSLDYSQSVQSQKQDQRPVAHRLTLEFLSELPRLRELLQTDTEAAYSGDPAAFSTEEIIVAYPFIEAIAIQRMAHELWRRKIPLIPRIMTEWAHARSGIDMHPGAQIGSHFFIDHGTGTVVGETCVIGDHVTLLAGVGLLGFLFVERRTARPLLPLGLFRRGAFHLGRHDLARTKTASDDRRSRHHLSGRNHSRRRHGRGCRQHHRRQRLSHGECPAELLGALRGGQGQGNEQTSPRSPRIQRLRDLTRQR